MELGLILEPLPVAVEGIEAIATLVDPNHGEARWSLQFALWLEALQAELPVPLRSSAYSLSLSLVDDACIARLNHDWRHVEGPTDVLAFSALEEAPPQPAQRPDALRQAPLELGDIVISLDTASRQARQAGHDLRREVLFLASHGLLHLLGWDHPDEASLDIMLARQDRLIELAAPPT